MANITPVFEDFVHDGWEPKHDTVTKALIGVHRGTLEIGMDVGIGTLEIGWPHVENLFTHIEERTRVLAMVDHRLARRGFKRLTDYACQPLTIPTRDHWAPKWRANVFRDLFNPSVHNQTLSTSAQVHVDVSHDEVIPVLEMFLSLSPIFIALNANSPVWGGRLDPEGMLAARQHFWYRFTKEHGYWNNVLCGSPSNDHGHQTERAPQSFEELASFISASKFLVHVHNGQIENPCLSFESWVTSNDRKLSDDEFREAFCNHEGTLRVKQLTYLDESSSALQLRMLMNEV